MSHIRFNRHEVFTRNDMDLVFKLQDDAMVDGDFVNYNYICGLFDGYLYAAIIPMCETNPKFNNLVTRIIASTL